MKSCRAFVDPVSLYIIGGLAVGIVVGSWRPLNAFKKPPPTQQLTELQAKLDVAQKEAEQARKDRDAAVSAERTKQEQQVRSVQQGAYGVGAALAKVPADHQTAEVKLAARMNNRVSLQLVAIIGQLPADQQAEMASLIEQALSDKQAEVDEANRKLALLDAKFSTVTEERNQLQAQIPVLTQKAVKAEGDAREAQAQVTTKTNEVKTWADKTDAAMRQNGSLWSSIKRAVFLLGGGYVFLAFILPAIVKVLNPTNPLKTLLRNLSGYLLAPIHFHDAKTKLDVLKK